MKDGRAQARARLLHYYLTTSYTASFHLDASISNPYTRQFHNREQALDWLETEYPNLIAAARTATYRPRVANLIAGLLFLHRAPSYDSMSDLKRFLTFVGLSDRRSSAGLAMSRLGSALEEMGRHEEAVTALQGAAAIFQQTHIAFGEAAALVELGSALREIGRYEEAITALADAAAIYHEQKLWDKERTVQDDIERVRQAQIARPHT
jgi:tetratricopeptide (TPR) repeat protein